MRRRTLALAALATSIGCGGDAPAGPPPGAVRITGETVAYVWGDRMIGIHHCPTCGCGTHWQSLGEDFGKMGINARLLDGFDEAATEVRRLDNAG